MNIAFDQPLMLLLALLAVPLLAIGWRTTVGMDFTRRIVALLLRALVVYALALMLAGPHTVRRHDSVTVIGVLDVSGSIRRFAELPEIADLGRRSNVEYLRRWFREATDTRTPDDRFGLVVFDGESVVISAPTRAEDYNDDNLEISREEGTNIAQAIRLGLALFPGDAARRMVLVTDGNQTSGDALEAARLAAGSDSAGSIADAANAAGVPIDILPIAYRVTGDVQLLRVETPPNAQPGQTVTVRMILESTEPTTGRLNLLLEDLPVDLNGEEPGFARPIALPRGQSVHLAQVKLGETPVNRFRAVFEPEEESLDRLNENNVAEAFTATPSKGSTLVITTRLDGGSSNIASILRDAQIPVQLLPADRFPIDLLSLQSYDLIVMENISAGQLDPEQQSLLVSYVNDLGGGLIMVGGNNAFGAGGWNGTPVEDILPLELDPSKELKLPRSALVLVLDKSGSMGEHVAGARATQQEVANEAAALAIESLRAENMVGVISFDLIAYVNVELCQNDDPDEITKLVRTIRPGGGTNLEPALSRAYQMLRDVEVEKKHVVCLSDGQSANTDLEPIATLMARAGIQLTTIAVGDRADRELLSRLADIGGGEFYAVRNPRTLPRVLVDSVQVLNQPLLKEGQFVPQVLPTGSALTSSLIDSPPLGGLVITVPKADTTASIEMVHPDGEPLLAHWQAGLGRAAAFTSDFSGEWSGQWIDWPQAATFWTQLARFIARPPMSQETELITTIENDELRIALEVFGDDDAQVEYLQVQGTVYLPDGSSLPATLRQTAPGRYETSVRATQAGNYIVALSPKRGQRRLAPAIGGISRATSPEFRRYQSNLALLEEIVDLTGGRRLALEDPRAVNLYDRSDLPTTFALLPAWRTILWIALGLFLLDVACRRIAWSGAAIRIAIERALARIRPARERAAMAGATLSSLRQSSESFDQRAAAQSEGLDQFQATGRIAPPPERDASGRIISGVGAPTQEGESREAAEERPAKKPAPDRRSVRAALDALRGSKRKIEPVETESDDTLADAESDDDQRAASRSSLLEAKRRARERLGGG